MTTVSWSDLEGGLSRCTPEEVKMLRMRYQKGMTEEAIASQLGITVAAASYRLNRGVEKAQGPCPCCGK